MTEFKFYLPPINNVRGAQNQYVTGTISDQRKFLRINLDAKQRIYVKRAEVVIAKKIMTGTDKSEIAYLPTASNTIGPPGVVSVSEINYAFVDNTVYTIKIKAQLVVDETNEVKTYYAEFGLKPSYEYLHRIDGGDKFILPDLVVVNESLVEGAAGSNIIVNCPINFVNETNDTRKPTKVSFLFDEVNIYLNQVSTPNTESLSSYSIDLPTYNPSGNYTLPQTSNNKLINDKAYFVFVSASYGDGFVITGQFSRPLHVIARPVIDSVIAYGLESDQSDADAPAISSVMNVNMTLGIVSSNLPSKSGNITFELSQGGVVMYKADLPISIVTLNGTIPYTVLKENLVKVWTTTAPAQNSNGSYTYDVSAKIEHITTYENESIFKKSANVSKPFTSDIVPLPSVVALNAWIAGANVAGTGDRTVDVANATTASGYALAPELGIVGKFSKNDFYGSGVTAGFFKDLDAVDALTKHKFTVSVNGSAVPVPELYQIQGHSNKSDQEMYIELFNSTINGDAVSGVNGVETVFTSSQVQGVKADSNQIISNNSQGGWTIENTGPDTNGATGGKLPKVNLYFYGNTTAAANQTASNSFKLNQASGAGMYAVFHQNAGANKYPGLYTYTTPTSSGGVNKASWYKSRIVYASVNDNAGDTVADQNKVGMTLIYTGTDDATLFPHIPSNRRVRYEIKYGSNLTNSNSDETVFSQELVNMLALMTSSVALPDVNAGSYNFRLLETGIFTSNSNFGQVKLRYNVLSRNHTSANGSFPNLPGPASTLGSAQQPIFFWIPSTDLFAQTNSVKVSVAIEPLAGETTRPAATESNTVVAVSKVNQYVMTSVPRFSQGTLTVPINNPTSSDAYFTHAIFTSNLAGPNALKEVSISTDGVFNIAVENPNIRGANCDYQVRYKISDPNASGSITGPISATYSVMLNDPPGLDNFSVTNFSYKTFNNDSESSFKFDVTFQTVGTRSVDGVIVYFESTTNDTITLMDVKKSDGTPLPSPNQAVIQLTNRSYTLQKNAPAANATLEEGVNIMYKNSEGNNAESANKWLNFRSGKIVFKPYILVGSEKDIQPVQLDITMFNIPTIPMPTNLTLTGGVKGSYAATSAAWNNALSTYASIGSSVTASYKLVLNESEVSAQVSNHGYTVDLSGVAASTVLTLKLQVKLTSSDTLSYLSDTAELSFTAASVDVAGLTSTVKRGSNDTVLRVERGVYTITPASGANVTEVKLIDNQVVANTNPEAAQVKVLTMAAVQPVGPTVNVYDLVADGYALGDDLDLQYRLKAGVQYNTKYGAADSSSSSSTPLFLTLASPTLEYIVATKPELQLESTYRVMNSGTYNGRIAINATINAKGLHAEGVLSVVFVLAQEGNFTNPDLSDSGVQYVIAFESVTGLTKSYTVGSNASLVPSSTDNLGATEVHELSVTDVAGFAEGGAGARTLVMGNLLEGDASTLYLDATGFDASRPITAVSVVATRLGNDIEFKELTPSPSPV